jgi:tetratricopeptide (TPR) repeat protein
MAVKTRDKNNTGNKAEKADSGRTAKRNRQDAVAAAREKAKHGLHHTLTITERVISHCMGAYKNIFVLDGKGEADFHREKGYNHFDKGNYEKAIDSFLEYIKANDEEDSEVLFYLGLSYAGREDFNEALNYLKRAEGLEPEDADIAMEIGKCYLKLEQYKEAGDYFAKAIETVPDAAENYYHMGASYEKRKRLKEAIDSYKKAIELEPRSPIYYHALGFAYESSGKHNDAIACFKKAMELEKTR